MANQGICPNPPNKPEVIAARIQKFRQEQEAKLTALGCIDPKPLTDDRESYPALNAVFSHAGISSENEVEYKDDTPVINMLGYSDDNDSSTGSVDG